MKEGEAIIHPWVNKSLEKAQAKVEGRNFDVRKQLLKFDDVMNEQRKVIFGQRREIMEDSDLSDMVADMRSQTIEDLTDEFMPPKSYADQWDGEGLYAAVIEKLGIDVPVMEWVAEEGVDNEVIVERLEAESEKFMAEKEASFGTETMRNIEKQLILQTIDAKWREHLLTLEHLRSVVGFRGYAQRDPLNEYKTEGFQLFERLLDSLRSDVTQKLGAIRPMTGGNNKPRLPQRRLQPQVVPRLLRMRQQTRLQQLMVLSKTTRQHGAIQTGMTLAPVDLVRNLSIATAASPKRRRISAPVRPRA